MKALKDRGTEFLQVPKSYFKTLRESLKNSKVKISEDLDILEVLKKLLIRLRIKKLIKFTDYDKK